jgi:hypothetical protein
MDCCWFTTIGEEASDEPDKIVLKRQIGSNYINACPKILFALTRSNCNLTLLRGKNVSYCTKYTAKAQDKVDSAAALAAYTAGIHKSYRRRELVEAERGDTMTVQEKGAGRLYSQVFWMTYGHEVASTMAALYVLRNRAPMYHSHPFACLMLYSAVAAIEGTDQVRITSTCWPFTFEGTCRTRVTRPPHHPPVPCPLRDTHRTYHSPFA